MKINIYDKFFIIIYRFYLKKFGKKELPLLTSIVVLGATSFVQLMTIFLGLSLFFNINSYIQILKRKDIIFFIIFIISFFQILYFFLGRRYFKIILKLRNSKFSKEHYFYRYIFITFLCLVSIILLLLYKNQKV